VAHVTGLQDTSRAREGRALVGRAFFGLFFDSRRTRKCVQRSQRLATTLYRSRLFLAALGPPRGRIFLLAFGQTALDDDAALTGCVLAIVDQILDHCGIGKRRGVTEICKVVFGDLSEDATHDLAGACLG